MSSATCSFILEEKEEQRGLEKRKKVSKYYINKNKPQYKSEVDISVLLHNRNKELCSRSIILI